MSLKEEWVRHWPKSVIDYSLEVIDDENSTTWQVREAFDSIAHTESIMSYIKKTGTFDGFCNKDCRNCEDYENDICDGFRFPKSVSYYAKI